MQLKVTAHRDKVEQCCILMEQEQKSIQKEAIACLW